MFVLDSLGMLSTEKEITDALNEKNVRDMTKAQLVKGTFRMLTLKLGLFKIPMLVTNHTYDVVGAYVPTKEMGGGSGLKYAASTIVYLSKKKEKDGKDVIGNIIKAKAAKSRLTKENKDVEIRLYYDERGLDRYYGLLELGELGGLWKNVAGRYEMNGKKIYAKQIWLNQRLTSLKKLCSNSTRSQKNSLPMDKFIKTFEGVFDAVTCQSLIDIFEDSVYQEKIENDGRPNFTQVNLNDHKEYSKFTQLVTYKIVDLMRLYKEALKSTPPGFTRFTLNNLELRSIDQTLPTCLMFM